MILDTSFLIDVMAADEAALARVEQLEARHIPQRVPTIAIYELFVGVGYTDRTESEVDRIEAVLDTRPIVDVDERTMRKAGRVKGRLKATGDNVSTGDVIVGASALVRDEPVLTRNEADFERVPDLEVRSY